MLSHVSADIDRAPFQVTETGWGEFEIAIKIFFVPESGEKPLQTHHHLKLHPWHPVSRPVVAPPPAAPTEAASTEGAAAAEADASADVSMASVEEKADDAQPQPQAEASQPAATQESSESQSKLVDPPPVVHSWAYEEIVFPEPLEPFYDILIAHPPTP